MNRFVTKAIKESDSQDTWSDWINFGDCIWIMIGSITSIDKTQAEAIC